MGSKGLVLLTDDQLYEVEKIRSLSGSYKRKFYVYGKDVFDLDYYRKALSDFSFVSFKETFEAKNSFLFSGNNTSDFFVLKHIRFSNIMDRNTEAFQTFLEGYKLVVDDHPFMGKKEISWSYFPWSFFDKSLLGYPHFYSFQRSGDLNPADIATKVKGSTDTTLKDIIDKDSIKVERIKLDADTKGSYQELKRDLFDKEIYSHAVIRKLRKFLQSRSPYLKKGFDLLNINKAHDQYKRGERYLFLSDAKVDIYLESIFNNYLDDLRIFMGVLNV